MQLARLMGPFSAILLFTSTLALPAHGAKLAPQSVSNWTVEPRGASLSFSSTFAGDRIVGQFRRWQANIAFAPTNLAHSHLFVTVDLASAVTGDPTRDQALPTADWFNVGRFPRAVFKSIAIRAVGPGKYVAIGELNMTGVSNPISLEFSLSGAGDRVQVNGRSTVDRHRFGVGRGQFAAAETVPYAVGIQFSFTAHKTGR